MNGPVSIVGVVVVLAVLLGAAFARPAARSHIESEPPRGPRHGRPSHHQVALIDVVERTSRDVRSGTALRPALLDALQRQPSQFLSVREQLVRGGSLGQALGVTPQACDADSAFVLHGLRLAADTGGSTADTLDRIVAVVHERHVWRGERRAQAAQARLSARMLTVLPLAVAAWGAASGPRVRHAYTDSPAAGVLTAIGVVLNLVGWWWMRRLVRGSESA